MQRVNSNDNLPRVWDTIGALQSILARSTHVVTTSKHRTPELVSLIQTTLAPRPKTGPINAVVTERQRQLDAVLGEIVGLETVMRSIENLHQQLVKKKDEITQSMNLHKRLVSTLWRLPAEVLSQVFHHCLPELYSSHLLSIPVLDYMCQSSPDIGKGKPSAITHGSSGHEDVLLSLSFQFDVDGSTKLRSLLQPYINEISSLHIRVNISVDADEPRILLEYLTGLQDLTLVIEEPDMSYERSIDVAQCILQLPFTMRSLRVVGQYLHHYDICPRNPVWAYLTNVETDIHDPGAFLRLLQLGPNLSSLKVYVASEQTRALEPFTHTELQSLHIGFGSISGNQSSSLFNSLSLPNLHVLKVSYVELWPHEEFKAFLARSNCALETLQILSPAVMTTDSQRAEYVALLPSLEVLVHPKPPDFYT
ncbi:hypothetical protein DFH29DRAFT_1084697 [Suillus ampliporus]|nr:hypothetical protein DFH29DRAFT_1084697 [Suillus ampliporus]